jgi:hypothetical protein
MRVDPGKPAIETNPSAASAQNYTGGNINFPSRSATAGYRRSLLSFSTTISSINITAFGTLALYDRIQAIGANFALATNRAPASPVNTLRYGGNVGANSAVNNEIWIEQVTASTAASVHNITYLDANGAQRIGPLFTAPNAITPVGSMYRYPLLAAGSFGVQQIQTATGTTASGGTGNYVIMKHIASISVSAMNTFTELNFLDNVLTMPRIHDDANLQLLWLPTQTTTSGFNVTGTITTVYN